tara:strand:- start:2220 stop:2501 length:282 start_codon:yes stop_codon:yes gene_type:complete
MLSLKARLLLLELELDKLSPEELQNELTACVPEGPTVQDFLSLHNHTPSSWDISFDNDVRVITVKTLHNTVNASFSDEFTSDESFNEICGLAA